MANPWVVTTTLTVGTTGLQLVQYTSYVNGDDFFRNDWKLNNLSTNTYNNLHFFHAEDLWTNNSDFGFGYFDPATGTIGGYDQTQTLLQRFIPISPTLGSLQR